jgi:hypothetical protein
MADTDRPQDVGRSHSRKRAGGAKDRALIERYQDTMRAELADLLAMLAPVPQDPGLGLVTVPPKRPDLATRSKIWDLAIKLGRELGAAIDPDPLTDGQTPVPPRRRKGRLEL